MSGFAKTANGGAKALLVAGVRSGCGKTTVSLALQAALVRRGLRVQAFKSGPDFIDTGLHARVTGRPGLNLDGWMMGRAAVLDTFHRHLDCDVALAEGAMGLFDGASGRDDAGSCAELARWLDMPVLLVVDASSMARSAAALVQGFVRFDPALRFAGVLFNRVGSPKHQELLAEAMAASCPEVPVLGMLPRAPELALPSRHLGLVTAEDIGLTASLTARLADWIERGLQLDRLLESLPTVADHEFRASRTDPPATPARARIGLARDRAFCFYYADNLTLLERYGAELVPFSPLTDAHLPEGLDGIYLGGGYPELHVRDLAANAGLREAIRSFARAGGPVYAECGGYMYLMEAIEDDQGVCWPMVGVFAARCRLGDRLQALGYRTIVTRAPGPLGPAGTRLRGHEFHYSCHVSLDSQAARIYTVRNHSDRELEPEGFLHDNCLGSYIHVHFANNPEAARGFVDNCAAWRERTSHVR